MSNRRIEKKQNTKKESEAKNIVLQKPATVSIDDDATIMKEKKENAQDVLIGSMNPPETAVVNTEDVEKKKFEKAKPTTVRTKITDSFIEFDGISISLSAVEKAVKKDAVSKKLKGEIIIYINVLDLAAYYTVNGAGSPEEKVLFSDIM